MPTDPQHAPDRSALPAAAYRSDAVRYGAYMLRKFGWFYYACGLGRLLGGLRFEEHSAERIRAAAHSGPIVYVLYHRSALDLLGLNTALNRHRLPLSVWANGFTAFYWQPVVEAWRDVGRRVKALFSAGPTPHPVNSGWLTETVASDTAVATVLDTDEDYDPFEAILAAQDRCDRPIQLLPVTVVWNRAPKKEGNHLLRFISGAAGPSWLSTLRNLWTGSRNAFIQVGDPVDLSALVERVPEGRRVRAVRMLLRRYLRRESQIIRGPQLLPYRVMRSLVLDNPPMRELARQEAEASGRTPERIREQMVKDYGQIAAHFRWSVIKVLEVVLDPLWSKVFAGVDVRDEDMERIRAAMRDGTAILVPCHKSHFDYLLLSWMFFEHGLIVPHVIAGMNLAIWPVSFVLRGAGGFFIKRTFRGERIFPAVFSRYLRELVRQGYPVEFFIEGGRSRSGKLLPPRLGVLGMVMDAAAVRPHDREVTLLPIAMSYDQVAEEGAYARELAGEHKRPETLGQVIQASLVFFRRYGRAYVRVGEPIPCSPIVDASDEHAGWDELDRQDHKERLQAIGERLVHRIGQATVVLPVPLVTLALMAHHRRGIRQVELLERTDRFRALLAFSGANEAISLQHYSQAVSHAIAELHQRKLLEAFDQDGERVWGISVDQRISLEFYKNQLLHYFATAGLAAAAIRPLADAPFARGNARSNFLALMWLLRREFVFDPDHTATELLQEGLDALVTHGALTAMETPVGLRYEVADTERMGEIYGLFRCFLEAYRLVLDEIGELAGADWDADALAGRVQVRQGDLLAAGVLTRPEALSKVTLTNAFKSFFEEGLMSTDQRDQIVLDEEALRRRRDAVTRLIS